MLYNVAQLLREPVGSSRRYDLDGELCGIDELNPGPTPVTGHVELIKTNEGIVARVMVSLPLVVACRRCLEAAEAMHEIAFDEVFLPSVDMETGARLATPEDEPELVIDGRNILDLTEVIRQFAVIETEDPVLCKPDCKGLCSQCGSNLNEGPCSCEQMTGDPRLAVLAQLVDAKDFKSSGERNK